MNKLTCVEFLNTPLNTVFVIEDGTALIFRILREWYEEDEKVIGFFHNIVSLDKKYFEYLDCSETTKYVIYPQINANDMLAQVKIQQEEKIKK